MKDLIRKEMQYNHPIADIWDAISNEDEISALFIKAEFKAEVGYQYTFTHEEITITGKVLEVDPIYNLVYTWVMGGTDVETTVKWRLEENAEGTLLVVEHSGISDYPTEEMITNMFTHYSEGWDGCISRLENYLKEPKHAEQNK